MSLGFRKFISEVFMNGKFPKILPSKNFPLYGSINSIIISLVSYYSSRKLIVGYFCVKRVYG